MQKYEWRCPGLYKIGADIAAKVVESCADANGYVQAAAVVEKSKPVDAELHEVFEWRDSLAADKWREQQARVLIKNIVTVEVRDDSECEVIKTFIHVVSDDCSRGYKQTAVAIQDINDREYVLRTALRELESFRTKYSKLSELAGLMSGIADTITAIKNERYGV